MKYLIEMPEGFPGDDPCKWCPIECQINPNHCPVAHAKKAVDVKGGIGRAIVTQFDKEVKLWVTEVKIMKKEAAEKEAVRRLQAMGAKRCDKEGEHTEADEILCLMLELADMKEVAEAFRKASKNFWYA